MLDTDLAELYGIETRVLNQAVRRNRDRFPGDFLIALTNQEFRRSRSQSVILNVGRGHNVKHPSLGFTEHGAIMAATVLNSPRAVQMTVFVVRAFVKMCESLLVNAVLAREMAALKSRVDTLDAETRKQFDQVFEAILGLSGPVRGRQ
jgi:phage regulator Rha-like protein